VHNPLFLSSKQDFSMPQIMRAIPNQTRQQTEHTADQIMRMPDPALQLSPAPPQINRKYATCDDDDKKLKMKPAPMPAQVPAAPGIVQTALASPGKPLDPGTRNFIAPRLGHPPFRQQARSGVESAAENGASNLTCETLLTLCVGVPTVTLATLIEAMQAALRRQARLLIPVVAIAAVSALVAELQAELDAITAAFEARWQNGADWARDEVHSYTWEHRFLVDALAALNRTC
jgi:hypothetical protein